MRICFSSISRYLILLIIFPLIILSYSSCSFTETQVDKNYVKNEYRIPMRDGIKLFTSVYVPNDSSDKYPIMMIRTPYSVNPYGKEKYPNSLGPSKLMMEEKFIFVYQDVRGKFMSEGEYVNMRPYILNKIDSTQFDETTDTYDTIEWLIKNIPNNNGRVGIWGISYPGFYAAMSAIDSHPALKAVSPQAPIADWFAGDDMHHNGAFSLSLAFNFFAVFDQPRSGPTQLRSPRPYYPSPDAYNFFLELGPLKMANEKYFNNIISFWNDGMNHGNYDGFWQSRNTLPHFNNIKPAVMTVGGWFDGEDLYGALHTYQSIEEKNEDAYNMLVMGPWPHGGWARTTGDSFGILDFNSNTSEFYQEKIELPFFNYFLKDKGELTLPDAYVFVTGSNRWLTFSQWPPNNIEQVSLFFHPGGSLSFQEPAYSNNEYFDEFISDPQNPVPYSANFHNTLSFYNRLYMVEDQRFAAARPDVLVYESDILEKDLTFVGLITTELYLSTSGTDSDWIVKLIDVLSDDEADPDNNPNNFEYGGYQMMIRGEIMRGKFRNSYEVPQPFIPNEITKVSFKLQDIFHTFKSGHKIMVQVQCSWFPIYDRNPQTFCDIYNADEKDFIKATQRVYYSKEYPSHIEFMIFDESVE